MLQKKSRKHRKKAGKHADSKEGVPSPSEIIREVDRLTQQALAIAGSKRRKRRHSGEDLIQLDRLLGQIKKLRELASKLHG